MSEIIFEAGNNIALKIPQATYEATLRFYRDILLLDVEEKILDHPTISKTAKIQFGHNTLWLDCMKEMTQPAAWLQLQTNDLTAAMNYLQTNGIIKDDTLEDIPKGMHWIKDPAGNVLLLKETE